MPHATVNASWPVRLFYTVHQAPKERGRCFLCMGFQTDGVMWMPQVNYLLERGYTCVAFDNRGCGRSEQPAGRYTTRLLARDAMELLSLELGWRPEEVHLVGVSMGGMISLEILVGLREGAFADLQGCPTGGNFRSAALLVTQAEGWRVPWRGLPPLEYARIMASTFSPGASTKAKMYRGMEQAFSKEWMRADSGQKHPKTGASLTNGQLIVRSGAKNWYAKKAEGIPPDNSTAGFLGQVSALASHYVSPARLEALVPHLREKSCPLLLICAGRDNLVRYSNQQHLARSLKPALTELLNIEQGSHGVTDEHEEEVNAAIGRLLDLSEAGTMPAASSRL